MTTIRIYLKWKLSSLKEGTTYTLNSLKYLRWLFLILAILYLLIEKWVPFALCLALSITIAAAFDYRKGEHIHWWRLKYRPQTNKEESG